MEKTDLVINLFEALFGDSFKKVKTNVLSELEAPVFYCWVQSVGNGVVFYNRALNPLFDKKGKAFCLIKDKTGRKVFHHCYPALFKWHKRSAMPNDNSGYYKFVRF